MIFMNLDSTDHPVHHYVGTDAEFDEDIAAEELREQEEEKRGSVIFASSELQNADMCLGTSMTAYFDSFNSPVFPQVSPELADVLSPGELVIAKRKDTTDKPRRRTIDDRLVAISTVAPQGIVTLYEKPAANKFEGRLVYAQYPDSMQQTLQEAVGPISKTEPVTDKQVERILGVYTEDFGPMGDDNLGNLLAQEHLDHVGPISTTFPVDRESRSGFDGHVTITDLI